MNQLKEKKLITKLATYKALIDADIKQWTEQAVSDSHEEFGVYPTEAVKAYCDLLNRGGKRIRGALTMNSYFLFGGTDRAVALHAARAIEMLHAYILMVDDIQDRSELRRGADAAHIILKKYHEKHYLKDDAQHFGESIAMNGFLFGAHQALNVLADLPLDADKKLAAIKNVNKHFIATAHGQSMDIFNEVVQTVEESDVDKVLLWKTAYYTFMNPLQLGAILAGASEKEIKTLEKYSLSAGRVFQITDDIIGVFSNEEASGKSPLDDIKEGKRTLLTVKAIELASKTDAYFLEQKLGNKQLTQAEFQRCREIIEQSGALKYARDKAKESVVDALTSLDDLNSDTTSEEYEFLVQLVQYLIDRKG